MGEAKKRQYSRKSFLAENPFCVYCGVSATTTDHCPPRCFFLGRMWPETFEYPACHSCNDVARLDELALSPLVRIRPSDEAMSGQKMEEFKKLVSGVANNHKDIVREWMSETANERKHSFRRIYGREEGDRRRAEGWGAMKIGPLTEALIKRFMIRLGQSIYYNHFGRRLNGVLYTRHSSLVQTPDPEKYLEAVLSIAPMSRPIVRGKTSLHEQFMYRFNMSEDQDMMYCVVGFNEQMIFLITAMGFEMAARFEEGRIDLQQGLGYRTVFDLTHAQRPPA